MPDSNSPAPPSTLPTDSIAGRVADLIPTDDVAGKRVLLIVPDHTRTAPLPILFPAVHDRLKEAGAAGLDVMVALGTHPPMPQARIESLLGIDPATRDDRFPGVALLNHEWDNPDALMSLGDLPCPEAAELSRGTLPDSVPVTINARIKDYDLLLVLGPVFPHEVVGFSGGNKYFFPGISGPELLNYFHWLGAIVTNAGIIGVPDTPVRRVVDAAAKLIPVERRALTFVVDPKADLYGLYYGTPESAWREASQMSERVHITRKPKPFHTVLSCAPPMYDELWVAGKCMYKLEPVVADGGELIIYAPHLSEVSETHGEAIRRVGYHTRDYFLGQWDKFKHEPWGTLAHSTHVRGGGTYEEGVEKPRVKVTLASQIPPEECEKLNLGYRDPATIDVEDFADREDEGVLLVRKAGEMLYRLDESS
nr:lactate racemase domain-containing protein [Alienimonas chondri]